MNRIMGAALLLLAVLGCFVSLSFMSGVPGDISTRDSCTAGTLHTYLHPQQAVAPPPDAISGANVGKECNDDAARRMHRVFLLLPLSLLVGALGAVAVMRPPRTRPAAASGASGAPGASAASAAPVPSQRPRVPRVITTPEPHSNLRIIKPE